MSTAEIPSPKARRDGFKARSGCFSCGCCERLTRRTSKGNSTLCPQCDDWTMAENALSDYGDNMSVDELATQEAFILQKKQEAVNLGGTLKGFAHIIAKTAGAAP